MLNKNKVGGLTLTQLQDFLQYDSTQDISIGERSTEQKREPRNRSTQMKSTDL